MSATSVSLFAIAGATRHDVPGDPSFFVTRQAIYITIGIIVAIFLIVNGAIGLGLLKWLHL